VPRRFLILNIELILMNFEGFKTGINRLLRTDRMTSLTLNLSDYSFGLYAAAQTGGDVPLRRIAVDTAA
jgi:hypothetical protein